MDQEGKLEQLLTAKQAAKLLNVSRQKLRLLGIPIIDFGRNCRRYDPADIRAWLARYKVDPDAVRQTAPTWRERKKQRAASVPRIPTVEEFIEDLTQKLYPNPRDREIHDRRSKAATEAWGRRHKKLAAERGIG